MEAHDKNDCFGRERKKQKQKRGEMNERACNKMLDYLGWKDMRYRTWSDAIKEMYKQLSPNFKTLKTLRNFSTAAI